MRIIVKEEIMPFSGEMFAGFYEQVITLWAQRQQIILDRVFSRN